MNKTRFYEITQAAAKGEDLSVFVPTNAAEAELIANLQGGGGSAELTIGKKGTKFGMDKTPLTKLYFNTSMSTTELKRLCEAYMECDLQNLYEEAGEMPVIFTAEAGVMAISVLYTGGGGCSIMAGNIATGDSVEICAALNGSDYDAWNPELFANKNYVTMQELFGVDSIDSFISVETNEPALEILSKIISVNNDFENEVELLQGTYDGTPISIEVNSSVPEVIDVVALLKENKLPKVIYINQP